MIHRLSIQNIVLVESAELTFGKGFNVLSGETGAGKSAIMAALLLVMGKKADTGLIRKGAKKALVEAEFALSPAVEAFLDEAGISHDTGENLIIRRDIGEQSRCFVNNQRVQTSYLKKIGEKILGFVGQHANQALFSLEYHRALVDLYGDLEEQVAHFKESFEEEKKVAKQLQELEGSEAKRLRALEVCQRELEEIAEAAIKEGEEESLFAEYTRLVHAEDTAKTLYALQGVLTEQLSQLNQGRTYMDALLSYDESISELATSFKSATLELQEVAGELERRTSQVVFDPSRLEEVNERLSTINGLKRKYGDVQEYQKERERELFDLGNADETIGKLRVKVEALVERNAKLAKALTQARLLVAEKLEKALTEQLHALNMEKAIFHIGISKHARSSTGEDGVEFFLTPNSGESQIAVKNCASGGEISRILLAIHTLLAGKERTPTLLFDEIDANIGGETAVQVGEKLKEIGKKHQVVCITHFPQVAKSADCHLCIHKKEKEGRTVTLVEALDAVSRQKELNRMSGSN